MWSLKFLWWVSCKGMDNYISVYAHEVTKILRVHYWSWQVTRLIPDARGTKCHQELEPINDTKHSHILRVPFQTDKGILHQWVSRFDIYPYLERFTQACTSDSRFFTCYLLPLMIFFPSYHTFAHLNRMQQPRFLSSWKGNQI